MSEGEISLVDLADIQVRTLDGSLKRKWRPRVLEISMTTTVGLDADENRATLDVGIELTGSDKEEDAERVLTYTGLVSLLIIPAKGFKFTEGTDEAANIVSLAWPYARASLIEHAQRLGSPTLRLPLIAKAGTVEPIESEAEVKV